MATYSFADIAATLDAPGASISLGAGNANAEEGISISYQDDRNDMTIGADGEGMHSRRMTKAGTITVRLLQTSPVNAKLVALFSAQNLDSALWGQNTITLSNDHSGDQWAARECAFARVPDYDYARDGGTVDWEFHAIKIDPVLGSYN